MSWWDDVIPGVDTVKRTPGNMKKEERALLRVLVVVLKMDENHVQT